jgi:hypothetical protein
VDRRRTGASIVICLIAIGTAIVSMNQPAYAQATPPTNSDQYCLIRNGVTECFADRASLLERESQIALQEGLAPVLPAASCSTPLRLYADAGYGGRELDFYDRGYWQNLSTWSFDNQLSSYKVGACSVYLADGAGGGGSLYPGNTSAGHNEASMLSGWNDRVSSIYIR